MELWRCLAVAALHCAATTGARRHTAIHCGTTVTAPRRTAITTIPLSAPDWFTRSTVVSTASPRCWMSTTACQASVIALGLEAVVAEGAAAAAAGSTLGTFCAAQDGIGGW